MSMTMSRSASLLAAMLARGAPAGPTPARPLERGPDPATAGLDAARRAPLRAELQRYVDQHQMAGAVAMIGRRGRIGTTVAVGFQDLDKRIPMRPDTVFRLASMTKIATTVAVMMLVDEGKLAVEDPVEKHLPEFRGQRLVESRARGNPPPAQRARLAVVYKKDGEGLARVEGGVLDGERVRYPAPSGGLFSTAADQARLYQMLLERGSHGGRRYLSEAAIENMTSVHFSAPAGVKGGFTPGLGMGLGGQGGREPAGGTQVLSPCPLGPG